MIDLKFLLNRYILNRRIVGGYDYAFTPFAGGAESEIFLTKHILKQGQCFLDIGANSGGWSIPAAKYYREVHAFEPSPAAFRALKRNIEANEVNVTPHNIALGEKNGVAEMNLYEKPGQDSFLPSHLGFNSTGRKVKVEVRPLDDYHLKPSVVKIDTEGFELPVIRGAERTIDQHHPKLLIETHRENDADSIRKLLSQYVWDSVRREVNGTSQTVLIGT